MQNILAQVVALAPWSVSSLDVRHDLHWLPVGHRITFKLCLLTWKTLHTAHPPYLSELITHYLPPRALRSSNTVVSDIAIFVLKRDVKLQLTLPTQIFWPDLPASLVTLPLGYSLFPHHLLGTHCLHRLCSLDKLSTFKRQLKSHLFQSAFAA